MVEKPDCDLCRKIKKAKGKEVDCLKCLGELQQENVIPFQLFWRLKNQVIMGPTYPVDIRMDIARAEIARVIKGPDDQDYCLDLITVGFSAYIKKIKELQEEKRHQ